MFSCKIYFDFCAPYCQYMPYQIHLLILKSQLKFNKKSLCYTNLPTFPFHLTCVDR